MSLDVNQNIIDNLRPDNRTPKHIAWLTVLLSPFKWVVDLWQDDYLAGASYSAYDAGTTYDKGDRVQYEYGIYESVVGSNTGQSIDDTDYWLKVQDDFIGLDTRRYFNSTKLMLEYALNTRYGTTFAQPPSTSDIYITKNTVQVKSFVSFPTEAGTSASYSTFSDKYVFNDTYYAPEFAYTINFPSATLSAITGGETAVRQYVDQYNIAGIIYEIDTY